jgi:hypothetical protein
MIGFTVADVEREADFFTKVLQFEKVADFRVVGSEYGKMEGVFNANMRIVHLRLGDKIVELTQYVSRLWLQNRRRDEFTLGEVNGAIS